ncbi:MAG: HAMP domain-containing protein [Clostridia bacterium]|nr:HAMP domain-containing protein [Clostridia bacterium]
MIKSLQSKMILIMFLFIFLIILFSAFVSIIRMEQVYFRGFDEEMLNTISSFGIEANSSNDNKDGELDQVSIEKLISNFNIYFSINKTNRNGMILDENNNILYSSEPDELTDEVKGYIADFSNHSEEHQLVNSNQANEYYFIYFIRDFQTGNTKYVIVVSQDKTYINSQLRDVALFYVACLFVVSIITIVVSALLASNVTKPIEIIRKKAQKIAAGDDIEEITLDDSQNSEYEVKRLVESFNLMISQIKNNLSEISSEKNKLEAILLHLSDGVLAFNTEGALIHANPAGKKLLDIKEETTFKEIFDRFNFDIDMEKIMYLDDWTKTEQMVKLNDSMIVNIFFAAFKNEQENLGGLVAVVHDVTKQVKLDDMRKGFVSDVSHELKTPLTSITTYTETLLDEMEPLEGENPEDVVVDREEEKRFLNVILSESNRMKEMVEGLLQLSRFDANKVIWKKIYFDLPELTKQICDKHRILADTKEQELDCYVTANVPMVYADRSGVEQVITNIISNAIKYTPEKGSIKVYVGCVHDDAYIKVIDNGIGIPEEDLPRVFERFYRVDKARSREMGGTGLGLPIAKEVIESNGGSIDMKSEVGKGTEVVIKVPVKEPENLN